MCSFLWLCNIPFFIHSSVDGHLGPFHVLAIVNSAAVINGIHVSFSVLVSSGYMSRSGIAGSDGGLFLLFKGISIPSSIVAVSIYIPTKSARVFPFRHTLSSTVYNSQDMEATQMPISRRMDKEAMVIYTMEYYSAIKKN